MQFQYPELLWALFLLLIPIIIHLFQLRRFKKTPFTNVKLLQKVVAESRRSSRLKKWLLLVSRLLIIAGLVFAFAQPFFANKSALSKKETVIYLDNSFSMQAKKDEGSLLEIAIQDLIKYVPKEYKFSLFTNDQVFRDVTLKEIQNELLTLNYSSNQLQLNQIDLKAKSLFNSDTTAVRNSIQISDFQESMLSESIELNGGIQKHLVQLLPDASINIAIDTVYISQNTPNSLELTTTLKGDVSVESIPVSLLNGEKLIAKTAAVFNENNSAQVQFTLPQNETIDGRIEISDATLFYDNQLFFNLNPKESIKVLSIGAAKDEFLSRIYTPGEFVFKKTSLANLNYSNIEEQNFIILNELQLLPLALQNALRSFLQNGGHLAIIPHPEANLESYNSFLAGYASTSLGEKIGFEQKITEISFSHPLYQNVFEKSVSNFQYPGVMGYFSARTRGSKILGYQNNAPFLIGAENLFLFTSSLNEEISNFKNSPLIVPTFYAMAANSLKLPQLYHQIGSPIEVDIPVVITSDEILKVQQGDYEFIPQQRYFANKTALIFRENPKEGGIYTIVDGENSIQNISFNDPRKESVLNYSDMENLPSASLNDDIGELFGQIEKDNRVTELWKWFVILALLFMLAEIIIQKIFK
ncbi:MAG: BatA domain-containing protein [Flavobacteriaceae bacterium]